MFLQKFKIKKLKKKNVKHYELSVVILNYFIQFDPKYNN